MEEIETEIISSAKLYNRQWVIATTGLILVEGTLDDYGISAIRGKLRLRSNNRGLSQLETDYSNKHIKKPRGLKYV